MRTFLNLSKTLLLALTPILTFAGNPTTTEQLVTSTADDQNFVNVTFENNSLWDIYYIYASSSSDTEWGDDRLGDEVLSSGESFTVRLRAGTYDFKFIDEDDDECTQFNVDLTNSDSYEISTEGWLDCIGDEGGDVISGGNTITFINSSMWDIYNLYASSSSNEDWGTDHLGSNILNTGESYSITLSDGTYDFKFIDEDGDECIAYNISISNSRTIDLTTDSWLACMSGESTPFGASSTSSTSSEMVAISIDNTSLWSIYNIYASPTSSNQWGVDRLGSEVLSAQGSYTFYLSPGRYDFKFIDEDGDECIINDVSISFDEHVEIDTDTWLECINQE